MLVYNLYSVLCQTRNNPIEEALKNYSSGPLPILGPDALKGNLLLTTRVLEGVIHKAAAIGNTLTGTKLFLFCCLHFSPMFMLCDFTLNKKE